MKVAMPVPVPGPTISAPDIAKDWDHVVPPPFDPEADESLGSEIIDRAGVFFPKPVADVIWGALKTINKVVFKGGTPNPPVPVRPGGWKFSALGDYGSGHSPQDEIAKNVAKGNPDLILTLGDNVYYNGTEQEFAKKWDPPKWFGDLRSHFPVLPALGNHDVRFDPDGAPYFRRFPELDKARFYSFEKGGVHFVALNSNESMAPDSPQYKWLAQDLAKSKQDWNVLYFHHPLHPGSAERKSPNLGYLAPLLAKYGVDLVLTGHEHNYQRSTPFTDAGTIEVVAGGGGDSLHPFYRGRPDYNAYRDVDFGHVEVEVHGDELIGRYVVRDGSVRDTWEIHNNTPYRAQPTA